MLHRFWALARPYRQRYAAGLVLLLATNGLALWIPWLLREAIASLERREPLSVIVRLAGTMVGIAVVQAVVRTISRWFILGASRHIVFDVRNRFFDRLLRLGPEFFDTERTGDIMSRGVNDTRMIQGLFGPGALNLLNTTIVYVAVSILLVRIDPWLTLISVVLYPVLFLAVNRISRKVYARSMAVQEQLAAISNRAQESISGIQQVKIYGQEQREIAAFRELATEHRRRNLSLALARGSMISLIGIVSGLGTLIVLWVGGRFVVTGRLELGDFVAFNAYLAMLVWPTIALGWIINTIQRGVGAMERISEITEREPAYFIDEATESGEPVGAPIEIRDLTFAYPSSPDKPVLSGVNLDIERGSRVALVGPVGSGKSTLANLLLRFYDPPPGTIRYDGRDLADISLGDLRRSIAYVPQESFLFSRSLRDNVAFADPEASDERVSAAVEMAQLAGDLEAFPQGLATQVGERGFTLSGGQRQRTALARALVCARPILILDDSLASVDADTERAILAALGRQVRDRTLVLITHRLTTLAGMDRIVVMEDGRIVDQGTHAELLARGGAYTRLFRQQELERRLDG